MSIFVFERFRHSILHTVQFGPFNFFFLQKRWRKPVISAQTRLEDRVRDHKLDKRMSRIRKVRVILKIHELMLKRRRGPFVSLQLMSRWRNIVGMNVGIGSFVNKYPHAFEVFKHPIRKNICCRVTRKMEDLIKEEEDAVREWEFEAVRRVKKLLMMTVNGTLHVHALRLIRRDLGLPEDFRDSILAKYSDEFKLVDLEIVQLVDRECELGVGEIEKWRENEYREKWLSEFEMRYAFPVKFPTGFKFASSFRSKLQNWQRLPYLKPYESKEVTCARSCEVVGRYEKRAVAVLHELLSLTVEKMVEVDLLAHFRKDFAIEVNVRELLLKHPGIFYLCTKGKTLTVFLREAYSKDCLIEPNPIYNVRRKMLDLILLGCRKTKELPASDEISKEPNVVCAVDEGGKRDGDWVIPILQNFNSEGLNCNMEDIGNTSE